MQFLGAVSFISRSSLHLSCLDSLSLYYWRHFRGRPYVLCLVFCCLAFWPDIHAFWFWPIFQSREEKDSSFAETHQAYPIWLVVMQIWRHFYGLLLPSMLIFSAKVLWWLLKEDPYVVPLKVLLFTLFWISPNGQYFTSSFLHMGLKLSKKKKWLLALKLMMIFCPRRFLKKRFFFKDHSLSFSMLLLVCTAASFFLFFIVLTRFPRCWRQALLQHVRNPCQPWQYLPQWCKEWQPCHEHQTILQPWVQSCQCSR